MRKISGGPEKTAAAIEIKNASCPVPFAPGLEFNSPAHGPWNIVHTGMLLPEARQIYVCAENCMRGVVLTAAEMNASDRFSCVILEEKDFLRGNIERLTVDGVTDILERIPEKPRAVLLFTVCVHHFLGCDLGWIYGQLEKRFPDIVFIRCYMDPIMQKRGLTPDQKLRKALYEPLKDQNPDTDVVTLLGSDFALDKSSDIKRLLKQNGYRLLELPGCKSWEEYQDLSRGRLFLSCYPPGKYGAGALGKRLGRRHLYLPGSFDYEEITAELKELGGALAVPVDAGYTAAEIDACEETLLRAKQVIGDTPIVIDYTFHPRPLGLAKILFTNGFNVRTVYLDSVSAEEKETFMWLKGHAPELKLAPTIQTSMRFAPRYTEEKTLAVGQKAAWFTGTRHFVNMVQGGGLWGFDGIRQTAELMKEAFCEEKDPRDLIVRKGWGCESCI